MIAATELNHCGEDLPAYVNGTLGAEQVRSVEVHLVHCAACRAEEADWRALGHAAQTAFAGGSAARGLLDRVWLQIEGQDGEIRRPAPAHRRGWFPRPLSGRSWAPSRGIAAGIAAVACLLLAAAFAGARADNFFDVFKPQQFAVVPLSVQDLQSLPDLSNYGTFTSDAAPLSQATSFDTPEAAAAAAGLTVRTPASLPASVPAATSYHVIPGSNAGFTFSAAKASAAAVAQGKTLPPMPPGLDGATLQVDTSPTVLAIYGGSLPTADDQTGGSDALNAIPALIIGQTPAPTVTAGGASAGDIERYLLSQPGISPQLAAAIRTLGTPGSTWPIPIPTGAAAAHSVQVQGVKGLAIGDSTGLGAGILWQKDDVVYAVAGTLSQQDLLSIANSLR